MDNTNFSSNPAILVYVMAQGDEMWRRRLDSHLMPLRREGRLTTWSPMDAAPGGDLEQEMTLQVEQASIVVLLLSPDYIESDQCYRLEQQAWAREDVQVVPVLLRPVDWQTKQMSLPVTLPRDGVFVTLSDDQDAALREIAREIRTLIDPQGVARLAPLPGAAPDEESWRADFLESYRAKICSDTALTQLQILGMSDPLSVSDVYVKVHLHRQPRASSELKAKESRDPMSILRQRRSRLEQRVETAIDPAMAVKSHKYCVLVGDPGAGKTTLLRRLTVQVAEQHVSGLPVLPIYLKLHELARQNDIDLFQVALQSVCEYGFPREPTELFLTDLMDQGKVLLLLDALDETVVGATSADAEQSYQDVSKAIQQIMKRFQALRVVVTSRKADYFRRRQLPGFTELEVLDFLPREIEQFVRKWFQHSGEALWQQSAGALIRDLKNKPRVATLAANPLLLTLIIVTYKNYARSLPDNRAQLYAKCVDMLLRNWDEERNIARLRTHIISVQDQELLLPEIAWHFHQRGLWYFPEQELLPIIEDFLASLGLSVQKAVDVLKEISSENGLLREQAPGYYGFLHLTIQEYFAAEYSKNETDELLKHLGDSWWEEVILLSAGRTRDAGPLLQHLVMPVGDHEIPEDIFYSKLILAGRYLAARPAISREYQHLRQVIPERLFATAHVCPYMIILEPLTEALVEIGRVFADNGLDEVNEQLIQLLSDEATSRALKYYIVAALGTYGSRKLSSILLTMFKQKQFKWIPTATIFEDLSLGVLENTLGNMGDQSTLSSLFELLKDDNARHEYYVDIVALIGRIGGALVIPRLIQLLEDPSVDILVRDAIPPVLGAYGDESIVLPVLAKWLVDLTQSCIEGLKLLDDPSSRRVLLSALSQHEIMVTDRTYIAYSLAVSRDDSIVPELFSLLEDAYLEERVKAAIAHTLVIIGNDLVRSQLLHLVTNLRVSDQIAREIVRGFSSVGASLLLPQLQPLEDIPTFSVALKQEIVITLGMLGDPMAVDSLIQLLAQTDDRDWDKSVRIIYSIAMQGSTAQIAAILHDTRYPSSVRIALLSALLELAEAQQKSLTATLSDIVMDEVVIEGVRKAAVSVLGQIANDHETVEMLIACLPGSNMADEIYQALWYVSRRAGVHVVPAGPGGMQLRIINWQEDKSSFRRVKNH